MSVWCRLKSQPAFFRYADFTGQALPAVDEVNMRKVRRIQIFSASLALGCSLCACGQATAAASPELQPLWKVSGSERSKSVVISDLHLGVDDSFSETVANKPYLVEFLKRIEATADVKELIIAGDFLDEWYLPMNYPAYSDSDAFYQKAIDNNEIVMAQLRSIIKHGITLVYVPGNHDMLLSSGILEKALPGLVQARDAEGLGVYYTGSRGNVAIEHGHRYDVFSAPDPVSNAEICGAEGILPPGYFYARYAASWVTEGRPSVQKNYPVIDTVPDKTDTDQYEAYLYYRVLSSEFNRMTPTEDASNPCFQLGIAGFHDPYSVDDMFPVKQADGTISAPVLYRNFQRSWPQRQEINQVKVTTDFIPSVAGAVGYEFLAGQAGMQYLNRPDSGIDVVIFGHTHIPQYLKTKSGVYLNDGTWVDHNTSDANGTTRTFAVIEDGNETAAALYTYGTDGTVSDISAKMIR
jgi:UDP-2,3-diacylglucosamine pyrophosphatase LpxH